jgi:hypothetical protein
VVEGSLCRDVRTSHRAGVEQIAPFEVVRGSSLIVEATLERPDRGMLALIGQLLVGQLARHGRKRWTDQAAPLDLKALDRRGGSLDVAANGRRLHDWLAGSATGNDRKRDEDTRSPLSHWRRPSTHSGSVVVQEVVLLQPSIDSRVLRRTGICDCLALQASGLSWSGFRRFSPP